MNALSSMPRLLTYTNKSFFCISLLKIIPRIASPFSCNHSFAKNLLFTPSRSFSQINVTSISPNPKTLKTPCREPWPKPSPMSYEEFVQKYVCSFEDYRQEIEDTYKKYNPEGLPSLEDIKTAYTMYCWGSYNRDKIHRQTHNPFSLL